jgi:hypothetical protein
MVSPSGVDTSWASRFVTVTSRRVAPRLARIVGPGKPPFTVINRPTAGFMKSVSIIILLLLLLVIITINIIITILLLLLLLLLIIIITTRSHEMARRGTPSGARIALSTNRSTDTVDSPAPPLIIIMMTKTNLPAWPVFIIPGPALQHGGPSVWLPSRSSSPPRPP